MEWIALILLALVLFWVFRQRGSQLTPSDLEKAMGSLKTEFSNSLSTQRTELNQTLQNVRMELLNSLSTQKTELGQTIGQTMQAVQTTITSSGDMLKNVGTQLGALGEVARQIQEIGKNMSNLQEILAPPKLRGELGEQLLENLLAQCLPKECYFLQHEYTDGTKVDVLICLAQGRIPVDSKFPLDVFRSLLAAKTEEEIKRASKEFESQVKKHIDKVAGYIRSSEGTLDFALMYVPAENIYYEMAVKEATAMGVLEYAQAKHVFPVSPNTFYAYLQAIAIGLRGLQLENRAREIYGRVREVEQILAQFQNEFRLVGKNIRLADEHYRDSSQLIEKAQTRLSFLGQEPGPSLPPPQGDQG